MGMSGAGSVAVDDLEAGEPFAGGLDCGPALAHGESGYLTIAGGMVIGLACVCGLALLAHRWAARGRRGLPGALAALGERSLTGYLAQSFLMAPPLAAWGLVRVAEGR